MKRFLALFAFASVLITAAPVWAEETPAAPAGTTAAAVVSAPAPAAPVELAAEITPPAAAPAAPSSQLKH